MRKVGYLLISIGLLLFGYTAYQLYEFSIGSEDKVVEAAVYLENYRIERSASARTTSEERFLIDREDFEAKKGEVFGTIEIPSIDLTLPIIEGSEQEHLKHGVGKMSETWFPGDGNQIFLTGHNDSAFVDVGKLEEGDRIILNMPYGQFEYKMHFSEIGHETEVERVGHMEEETLVLMTCYPFYSITTEKRYFIYAEPVS